MKRRTVLKSVWLAPAVVAATAVPLASASPEVGPDTNWFLAQHHFGTAGNGVAAVDFRLGAYGADRLVELTVVVEVSGSEPRFWADVWDTSTGQYVISERFPGYTAAGNQEFSVTVNGRSWTHQAWVSAW